MVRLAHAVSLLAGFLVWSALVSSSAAKTFERPLGNCKDVSSVSQDRICSDTFEVTMGNNVSYTWMVEYGDRDFDVLVNLIPTTGDVDLVVINPDGLVFQSYFGSGNDTIMLVRERRVAPLPTDGSDASASLRNEVAGGEYTIIVQGYAVASKYTLQVQTVGRPLQLRPVAVDAIDAMLQKCCVGDSACQELKRLYPEIWDDSEGSPEAPYCQMKGILCYTKNDWISQLVMEDIGLSCPFPAAELSQLKHLLRLNLGNNFITGDIEPIAASLATIPTLIAVELQSNLLTGRLDKACKLASNITMEIQLDRNNIEGSIPGCFASAPALQELYLSFNALNGTIPALPDTSKLAAFSAASQRTYGGLTGSIPRLDRLQNLFNIDLRGNNLGGPLPAIPSKLVELHLSGNNLEGTIPDAYNGSLILKILNLGSNALTGSIPDILVRESPPTMEVLDLSANQLGGPLPNYWNDMMQLRVIALHDNQFTGTLPSSFALLQRVVSMTLHNNALSGSLVGYSFMVLAQRSDLNSDLMQFNIANNSFTGTFSKMEGFRDLGVFNSKNSSLMWGGAQVPRVADFSNNNFTGVFPQWLLQALAESKEAAAVKLQGNRLTCPTNKYQISKPIAQESLSNLTCYSVASGKSWKDVTNTTQQKAISEFYTTKLGSKKMSGGAVAGIVILVLVLVGAAAGGGWWYFKGRTNLDGWGGRQFQAFDEHAPHETRAFADPTWGSKTSSKAGVHELQMERPDSIRTGTRF